ncbi:RsmB/NOP family class I SAM-dependent RNA methyltransferase [Paracoccus sp. (in: a-proteobacteria)]|uniref:RsmB/NOP family class I SAM-dependent RNA methyltransferase n=1 Tax=Paracoccus sp. TaxID=267 RepID=UPI002AFFC658|nr:RsmB/NOP family class I SAM-dependent RNA methyltransferase [Paracoccus sp. (in: a-proteobacteria)]
MTPSARVAAAIIILDHILEGQAAEAALIRWARASRFAGSGDRAAVRDLVFDALRRLRSRAALGGVLSGRGLLLGMCREEGIEPASLFTGDRYAPSALSDAEHQAGHTPTPDEALDLPDWLIPLWRQALGPDATPVALAMRDRAPAWLRVNQRRTDPDTAAAALAEQGVATAPHPELPTALRITDGARRLATCSAYREGLVELQDLSPQMACALLPARGSLLDFCAGGGGKALALAAQGAGPVTVHDIDAGRMTDLPTRAERAGVHLRLTAPGKVTGRFDTVLADVPCSGSGTWRRSPDAKWRLTRDELRQLAALQSRILTQAAGFVADGGQLAYMTCSVLSCENDEQVQGFLNENPQFERILVRHFSPLSASDGFYLALMRRR